MEPMDRQTKWDLRFLTLAKEVSNWSKDPSTQVGAIITTPDHEIVSTGYNGFPKGVNDYRVRYADRELKYQLIVHGEMNALCFAKGQTQGNTLYTWPFAPCCRCAGIVIQHGIKRVVAPEMSEEIRQRWTREVELTKMMFQEAGVELVIYSWDQLKELL